MTDSNLAIAGHNNPPSAIEEIQAAHDGLFIEVANWLDGASVENDGQSEAVDKLLAAVKEVIKEADTAKENEYRPHKAAGDAVVAAWKPFLTDLTRMITGLKAANEPFKVAKAAALERERRAKEHAAREAMRAAEEAARVATATNLEIQREADMAMQAARAAQSEAKAVEQVRGLRTFTIYEVTNEAICLKWIKDNVREEFETFLANCAKRYGDIPGVKVRTEKRAI